jgi:hypothetical protein
MIACCANGDETCAREATVWLPAYFLVLSWPECSLQIEMFGLSLASSRSGFNREMITLSSAPNLQARWESPFLDSLAGKFFCNGRQFAARIGQVLRKYSNGEKQRLPE